MVQNTGKHWSKRKHMEWVKLAATGIHVKWWKEDLSIYLIVYLAFFMTNPTGNYIFKVNIRNTRTSCEICSKLTIKTPEWRYWRRSGVFIVNFEQVNASWVPYLWSLVTTTLARCSAVIKLLSQTHLILNLRWPFQTNKKFLRGRVK